MQVMFYGRLGEQIGRSVEIAVPEGGCSVAELRRSIASDHPHAAEAILGSHVRASVGDVIVPEDRLLMPNETVEFFPPVSGG